MYLKFYDLTKKPFQLTPDPYFLYLSQSHKEAIASIAYAISERKGFMALFGEVGTGKTTVVRTYLARANRKVVKPIYIFDPNVTFQDLVRTILFELGEEPAKGPSLNLTRQLSQVLIEQYQKGAIVVLIIDESHLMPPETLEKLRLLSNLETAENKLIQVIMAGPPEFEERLKSPELRQLNQRIAVKSRIQLLQPEDSLLYISHRISRSGAAPDAVFSREAIDAIVEAAQGSPRVLNILCDNALVTGFAYEERPVSPAAAQEIIADYSGSSKPSEPAAPQRKKSFPMPSVAAPAERETMTPFNEPQVEPTLEKPHHPPFLFGFNREQNEENQPEIKARSSKAKERLWRLFTTEEPNGKRRVSPLRVMATAAGCFVLFILLNGSATNSAQPVPDPQADYSYRESKPAYAYQEPGNSGTGSHRTVTVKTEETPLVPQTHTYDSEPSRILPYSGMNKPQKTAYSAPINAFMGRLSTEYRMPAEPKMAHYIGDMSASPAVEDSTLLKTAREKKSVDVERKPPENHIPNFPVVRIIRRGDSLSELCSRVYGTSKPWILKRVMDYNPDISSTNDIKVGYKIYFPEPGDPPKL